MIQPTFGIELSSRIGVWLVHDAGLIDDIPVGIVGVALGCGARTVREVRHGAEAVLMVEECAAAFRDRNGFINPRPMRVASLERVRPVILQQDIFAVVDVALGLAVGDFLNPPPKPVVAVCGSERGGGIPRHEVVHLRQPILRIIRVLGVIPGREERLPDEIAVVIILVTVRRIGGQLIAGVRHVPGRGSVADWIVRE